MENVIEKTIEVKAPVSRVWKAVTDYREFGAWFRVALEGPFVEGEVSTGFITWPGYEHLRWTATVKAIEPETRFAFTWLPYAIDPKVDYSGETPTLVEFLLEPSGDGTRLTVRESGFENVPEWRRAEAFRMNSNGWGQQVENVKKHVEA
ncbi:MAG: SRPBCC family protein [Acidobacteriota bacterium]